MALDILTWIFAGAFGTVLVLLIYLILAYIWPMRGSPAMVILHAKRNTKKGQHPTVVALDDGSRYIWKAIKNTGQGVLMDNEGIPIRVGPKSLKWSMGILFGVGEYFRSQLANTKMVDLIDKLRKKGITEEEFVQKIASIEKDVQEEIERMQRGESVAKDKQKELQESVESARVENIRLQREMEKLREDSHVQEQDTDTLDTYDQTAGTNTASRPS